MLDLGWQYTASQLLAEHGWPQQWIAVGRIPHLIGAH
jgi:hypothetical protein